MLRKSVETRDWLNTIEPRNVRAVMKRVVEDISAMDSQVGQLYEEGVRKERSSDSSRRTFNFSMSRQQTRSQWNYAPRYMLCSCWPVSQVVSISFTKKTVFIMLLAQGRIVTCCSTLTLNTC